MRARALGFGCARPSRWSGGLLQRGWFHSASAVCTANTENNQNVQQTTKSLEELRAELGALERKAASIREAIQKYKDPKKKNLLVLGAGRSSSALIDYFLKHSKTLGWRVKVGDGNEDAAKARVGNHPDGIAFKFDANSAAQREEEIQKADIVVSLLPPHMHYLVAKDCIRYNTNMTTASYASGAILELDQQAKDRGVLIMMECGVDPGIDHMAISRALARVRAEGGELDTFQSFTGGLVAPESDDNPWGYKFTWNPRNVVLAGQGVSKFIHNGKYKYIPYHQVFKRIEDIVVEGHGLFEGYANRDSLHYRDIYKLHGCPTVFRGTLRKPGFCSAWDVFVRLGMTDDTYTLENSETMTNRDFINSFLLWRPGDSVELKLAYLMGISVDSDVMKKLRWLGIFDDRLIGLKNATPAQMLQHILEKKWALNKGDKDMIVMWNQFIYGTPRGNMRELVMSMAFKGDGTDIGTAMAKTVGLPLAMVTRLVLEKKVSLTGVHIPTMPEVYDPVLQELEQYDIKFTTKEQDLRTMRQDYVYGH